MDSKKAIIEKKIHEEKAFKIVSQLALETIDEKTLISIVEKLFYILNLKALKNSKSF